jgi:proteic killer suppression protein
MIRSFRDKDAERLFQGRPAKRLPGDIQRRAKMRLERIDAACALEDLREPPSHRLEALSGKRQGQYSIRINGQWRVCFEWRDGHAYEVEIVDYH